MPSRDADDRRSYEGRRDEDRNRQHLIVLTERLDDQVHLLMKELASARDVVQAVNTRVANLEYKLQVKEQQHAAVDAYVRAREEREEQTFGRRDRIIAGLIAAAVLITNIVAVILQG